jgi:hypothetical protein
MKRISLLTTVFALSVATAALHAKEPAEKTVQGSVHTIAADSITVSPQAGKAYGEPVKSKITDKTDIKVGGKAAKVADIKAGDSVTVKIDPDGNATAISVSVIIVD